MASLSRPSIARKVRGRRGDRASAVQEYPTPQAAIRPGMHIPQPGQVIALQRAIGNQAVARLLARRPQLNPPIQRMYVKLGTDPATASQTPTGMGEETELTSAIRGQIQGGDTVLHIIAHAEGYAEGSCDQISGHTPKNFALLLKGLSVVQRGDRQRMQATLTQIHIHACYSRTFAQALKAALVEIDGRNAGIQVSGTRGLSVTDLDNNFRVLHAEIDSRTFENKRSTLTESQFRRWITANAYDLGDGYQTY